MQLQRKPVLLLDGASMTITKLVELGKGSFVVGLTNLAWEKIRASRRVIDDVLLGEEAVYGVNTGFGNFSDVKVSKENLDKLQINLIRSHAAGVGDTLEIALTRMLFVLRLNVLAKGYSGISEETLRRAIDAFNADCLPEIPVLGTLGASGDLAPLAHLALGLMGEGRMWNPKTHMYEPAHRVLQDNNILPLKLHAKEGLALINGTQFITALGAAALKKAQNLVITADYICSFCVEALHGTYKAFLPEIHAARPHPGQIRSAANIRKCLHSEKFPSPLYQSHEKCPKVQDAYSLRCAPQVHGIVYETIDFVKIILEREMNSATDNPMVFSDTKSILSGGNFHGEYPAKVLDYLAIAVHELGNISERRMERLVNPHLSELEAFLVKEGGLNSGFMIAHCTAAALVSENKTLCHPASVDSIPTSAEKEDHVSMGGWAARKVLNVVSNVEIILAIELLAICQAIDLRRPERTTYPLEKLHETIREFVSFWDQDRYIKPDIDAVAKFIREEGVPNTIAQAIASKL
jgi:histidine ammonia-lyase